MEKDDNVDTAQKSLDNFIYDYFVSKNLVSVAETFAKEANFQPPQVLGDGFLPHWWSLFWDINSYMCEDNPEGNQASTSTTPHESFASVPPNADHVSLAPDVQLQSMIMRSVEEPLASNPTTGPRPETEGVEASFRLPPVDLDLNVPPPNDHTVAVLPNLPQFEAEMGSSSYRKQRVNWKQRARNVGTGSRGPNTLVQTPPAQEIKILDDDIAKLEDTETFAKEANFQPPQVLGDGILPDWWSLFWDLSSYIFEDNPEGNQVSTSTTPPQSCASVPPNRDHVSLAPDVQLQSMITRSVEESLAPNQIDMVQGIRPSLTSPGNSNPTTVPRPETGCLDLNFPPPNDHTVAVLPKVPQVEAERGSSSHRKKRVNWKRRDRNVGTGSRGPNTLVQTPPAQEIKILGDSAKLEDTDLVSVIMEKDDNVNKSQKTLDLYIYDYLARNNLHSVAETFAEEANFLPKPVAFDDGLLSDWWSIFWDVYCSTPGNDTPASTSVPHQSSAFVQPPPDPIYMVKYIPPSVQEAIPMTAKEALELPPMNLPQAEAGHPMGSLPQSSSRPEIGSSSSRKQRVHKRLQNRRRARNTGTGSRRPTTTSTTLASNPPAPEILILDTSPELEHTGSPASSP